MIQEITPPNKESKAKDLNTLFKKHKKLIQEYYKFTPFKEPILFLIRRNGKVEFKENATTGKYTFKHTNGEERYIIIEKNQLNFQIGDKQIKGYIAHEDQPFTLPEEPTLTTEQFNMIIDKTLHDKKEWETKLAREKGKMIIRIGIAIAIVIGAITIYKVLAPNNPQTTTQALQTGLEVVKVNATAIKGTTII